MRSWRRFWRDLEPVLFAATVLIVLFGGLYLFLQAGNDTPDPNALDREGVMITTTTTTTTTLPPT